MQGGGGDTIIIIIIISICMQRQHGLGLVFVRLNMRNSNRYYLRTCDSVLSDEGARSIDSLEI